jgi:hypothetical protein
MNVFLIKWAIILAVGGGLIYGAYAWAYNRGEADGRAQIQAKFDKHLAADKKAAREAAEAQAAAEKVARDSEALQRQKYDELAQQFEAHKKESQDAYDRDVAALRAGSLKLRAQWQGCQRSLSGAASDPAESDGLARLREEGAANLVRLFRDADTQIKDLQTALSICHAGYHP